MLQNPWCVIVNAESCKAGWKKWQQLLIASKVHCSVCYTHSLADLENEIRSHLEQGYRQYLFAGGDGTLHHGGNLLMQHAGEKSGEIILGILPCGTGNDWKRTFGVPPQSLLTSLHERKSVPLHLLKLEWPDGNIRYAFNMIGAGLDAAVVNHINMHPALNKIGFLKYPVALMQTLLKEKKWEAVINVDDKIFEGDWLTIEAGFGKYCGGGMYVLPHASADVPGLLIMRPKSIFRIAASINKLYNGKIARQPEAIALHFSKIEIGMKQKSVPVEADGESLGYSPVVITPVYNALRILQ